MSEDFVEAELRIKTLQVLMKRTKGKFCTDENDILTIASNKGIEVCQMIEKNSGKRLGLVEGFSDKCSIIEYREKMKPNEKYINLHNHPNYTAHSIADLYMLLTHEEICEIHVISADRTYIATFEDSIEITKEEFNALANEVFLNISDDNISIREKLYKRNLGLGRIFDIIIAEELV